MTYPLAYQIYSSRNFPPLEAQLPELAAMGYDAIEPWLPAYESGPAAFRRAVEAAGMRIIGFHMPLDGLAADPARWCDIAEEIGAEVLIPPFVPAEQRQDTPDFWRGVGETLARGADEAAKRGLTVAWHNHDFEYAALPDGTRPIDHILGVSDAVKFEIDIGWIVRGGADPAEELRRYADRIVAIQLKDTAGPEGRGTEDGWRATGDGIIDWDGLVPLMRATAATHVVAEHDNPADWRDFAARSATEMRRLGLAGGA
ncbi:sugar phosphate isomerase/epimerase family protein [Wenxinia marina]|uniref:Sugar phosphate isomerase/epimerase n=1 Tax=Wenxinia marina DSM 24838 TaxID=1123501 RepID=A0A0D0QEC1_9RHOB|nr:sugar phosphate isomerase/epimerase [Wenxinia marina]KIQ69373.1 Sugar phosphate isomerase/epimerase [Wenxinia marina DSM 24838]GGL57820.1 xylose isomerase [Wenxinia marina]